MSVADEPKSFKCVTDKSGSAIGAADCISLGDAGSRPHGTKRVKKALRAPMFGGIELICAVGTMLHMLSNVEVAGAMGRYHAASSN